MERKARPRPGMRVPFGAWAAIGLLGLAAALELGVRAFVPMDVLLYRDSLDPKLRFELVPGRRGVSYGVPVAISAQGLRDEEVPARKSADEVRVVVVGDEHAFGRGVEVEKGVVRALAGLLPDFKGRVRLVNLSVFRYNLQQKTELLCGRLRAFEPDFVVVQLSPDDLMPQPGPLLGLPGLKNSLREWSRAARYFGERAWAKRRRAPPLPPPATPVNPLDRLRECLAGTPAAVALLPDFEASPPGGADLLRRAAAERGLPLWDLEAELGRPEFRHAAGPWIGAPAHAAAARRIAPLLNKALKARSKPGA